VQPNCRFQTSWGKLSFIKAATHFTNFSHPAESREETIQLKTVYLLFSVVVVLVSASQPMEYLT
jgi:hypothetical protein